MASRTSGTRMLDACSAPGGKATVLGRRFPRAGLTAVERNPARALRLQARCDALLVPAWWPWRRDHIWRALLQARAIENGIYTVGCCIAASEHPAEGFAGAGNYVFDPLGDPVPTADDHTYDLLEARRDALLVNPLDTCMDISEVKVFG